MARWSPEERYKLDVLATIAHGSHVNGLDLLLHRAPPWAARWLLELIDDGLVALTRGEAALSREEAASILSGSTRPLDVQVLTLPKAYVLEDEPARFFRYASGDRTAV